MHVIGLAAGPGTTLEIHAQGPGAEEAVGALRTFIERETFDPEPPKDAK